MSKIRITPEDEQCKFLDGSVESLRECGCFNCNAELDSWPPDTAHVHKFSSRGYCRCGMDKHNFEYTEEQEANDNLHDAINETLQDVREAIAVLVHSLEFFDRVIARREIRLYTPFDLRKFE